ncbi:Cobalt/zinc/cadmium efflux RND transporter [Klebsiella michiganensis]|nr:Cobalt/zinc/cadmium efflux RND transporter [Klebsiella michiganensis]
MINRVNRRLWIWIWCPRYADEGAGEDAGGVQISARQQQNLGVRTANVSRQTLAMKLNAFATVAIDERGVETVPALASGLIEKLYVNASQQFVKKNEALAELWIPQWAAAQQEYLAVRRLGDSGLTAAARDRLRLQFMPEAVIRSVERKRSTANPHDGARAARWLRQQAGCAHRRAGHDSPNRCSSWPASIRSGS